MTLEQNKLYAQNGYQLLPSGLSADHLAKLDEEIDSYLQSEIAKGKAGVRNALDQCPKLAELAGRAFGLESLFGDRPANIVRCVIFDKTPSTNWNIGWHQDLNIKNNGVNAVPREKLSDVVTLRLHLDPTPEENGALRVLPGSHKHGAMTDEERRALSTPESVVEAEPGDILLMSPLLVHASSRCTQPSRRRIVHTDYLLG